MADPSSSVNQATSVQRLNLSLNKGRSPSQSAFSSKNETHNHSPSSSTTVTRSADGDTDPVWQGYGQAFEFVYDEIAPLIPHRHEDSVDPDVDGADEARGPLGFIIESNWFLLGIGLVILANLISLIVELMPGEHRPFLAALDNFFLAVYLLELVLRVINFGSAFFCKSEDTAWSRVFWNWVDLIIVVSGIADQWVLPGIHLAAGQGSGYLVSVRAFRIGRFVKVMRFMRVLRVVKLVRVFLAADFSWAESSCFQSLVGVVIALNALLMGVETDFKSSAWVWIEQALLMFFVLELFFRLRLQGLRFFTNADDRWWNVLDITVVLTGSFDQWVVQLWYALVVKERAESTIGEMMMLARMLRLMRILRLVRVVKAVRPLHQLAIVVVHGMQSMFWVLVLTFVALYTFAVLTTCMIGKALLAMHDEGIPPETMHMFSTIPDSMFTLFAMMNGQEWERLEPLLERMPWTKPIFAIFTIYCSWALLSVMTGVVSEHMQSVRQTTEYEETRQENYEARMKALAQLFSSADTAGDGRISREAFMDVLSSSYHAARLQQALNQPVADVERSFDWLDIDGTGRVDFQEFCESIESLGEPVTGPLMLKLVTNVNRTCTKLERRLGDIGAAISTLRKGYESQHVDTMEHIRCILDMRDMAQAFRKCRTTSFEFDHANAAENPRSSFRKRTISLKSDISLRSPGADSNSNSSQQVQVSMGQDRAAFANRQSKSLTDIGNLSQTEAEPIKFRKRTCSFKDEVGSLGS